MKNWICHGGDSTVLVCHDESTRQQRVPWFPVGQALAKLNGRLWPSAGMMEGFLE